MFIVKWSIDLKQIALGVFVLKVACAGLSDWTIYLHVFRFLSYVHGVISKHEDHFTSVASVSIRVCDSTWICVVELNYTLFIGSGI